MREYELVFIIQPDLEEAEVEEVISRVQGWITDDGGKVGKTDLWGKRKLAYPIRKQTEGNYVLMNVSLAPTFGKELERNMRFYEPVMRYLLTAK